MYLSTYPYYHPHARVRRRLPLKYRVLVWVVCEEGLEKEGDRITLRILRRKPTSASPEEDGEEEELYSSENDAPSFHSDIDDDFEDEEVEVVGGYGMSASDEEDEEDSYLGQDERERMYVDRADMDIDIDATGVSVASPSDQVDEGMRAAHLVSGELTLEVGKTKLSLESAHMHHVHHRPGVPPPFSVPSSTNSNSNSNSTPSSSTSTSTSTQCTYLQADASDTKAKGEVLAGTMGLDTETQTTTPTTQVSQTPPAQTTQTPPAQTTQTIPTMPSNKPTPSLTNPSSPPKPHQPKRTRRPFCTSTAHDYLSTKELLRRAPCPIMVRRGTLPSPPESGSAETVPTSLG